MTRVRRLVTMLALLAGGPAWASTGDCVVRDASGTEVAGDCTLDGPEGPGETAALVIAGMPVAQVTFLDGAGFMWANTLRVDGQILRFDPNVGETNCWVAETGPALLCVDGLGIH